MEGDDETLPASSPGGTPAAADSGPRAGARGDEHQALIGQRVADRYRVTTLLGAGGMGAVYLARDESLQRDVALKVVKPALADNTTVVSRLVREAQAVAALNHAAIVTIHDAGFRGDVPFIVMEKLEGESLDRRLRRGPLSLAGSVRIVARVLEGLAAAHEKGIVHRDIKPANIFLCAPDEAAKVLDFGVASVARVAESDPKLTEAGTGVGTPLYMAPEQIHGEEPTARTDLYAVGAVLYELISHTPPFVARTLPELYVQKATRAPKPLREVMPDVAPALAALVDRSLARDPAERPADALAMRDALLAAVAGLSTTERERAPRPVLRDEAVMGASTTGASNVTPAAVEIARSQTRTGTTTSLGSPRMLVASVALTAALGVGTAFWMSSRASIRGTAAPSRATVTPPLHATPALTEPAAGLRTLGQYHDASGSARSLLNTPDLWDLAASDFERAVTQTGAPVRWRAAQRVCEGRARAMRGELDRAVATLREAIALDENWAAAHVVLADAQAHAGDVPGAVASVHRAEQLEPEWWVPAATLAGIYAASGQSDEAIQGYRRARAIAPREPSVLDGLALALHSARLDPEADRISEEALALDPDLIWSHVVRAERALERGDGATALTEASRAVSVSPSMAAAQLARADALLLLGRGEEARGVFEEALRLLDAGRQMGLPGDRVAVVREALAHDRLPPRRGIDLGSGGRSRPSSRGTSGGGGRTHGANRSSGPDALDSLGL